MAFDAGYREGVTLGQQDRGRNSRSNYQDSATYRSGDMGYRSSYGDRVLPGAVPRRHPARL